MCNSEQQSIEQNICELLQQIKGCCTSKEEIDNIKLQLDSIQLWINEFDRLTSNDIVINQSIGDFPQNTPIQTILEYLYENINNSAEGDYQDSIQFKKTGINLGSNGTVKEINFIGGGIDVNRTANVLTVNVPSSNTNLSVINRTSTTLDVQSSTGVNATLPPATTSLAGLFTSVDKLKLDGIQSGAEQNVNADWNSTSGDSLILNKPIIPSITGLATISYVDSQDGLKQNKIQFKNQGVNLGILGVVETIDFTGSSVVATLVGNVLTVDIIGGGGGSGSTNLGYTPSPTQGVVTSDTGVDAILPLADGTNAGLLSPIQFNKLGNISVTQAVDLDQIEADTVINNAKISNATHTGDVTGDTVLTLATVNSNTGIFGNGTQIPIITTNGKGLITAISVAPIGANLTKTDDTNVTLTLGGTPLGSLLNAVSLNLGWSGVLSIGRGGTGLGSLGTANQQIRVNAGGTALEYFTPSSAGIASLNGLTTATQTFVNDTNVSIVSNTSTHTITWLGTLADSRITSSSNWNKSYQQNKIRVVSVNTTLSATTDGTVVFDTASTTATLPSSVNETILVVKNNSGGTITVSGHIDGIASSNYVLQTRESMKFHGNGTTWYYIG